MILINVLGKINSPPFPSVINKYIFFSSSQIDLDHIEISLDQGLLRILLTVLEKLLAHDPVVLSHALDFYSPINFNACILLRLLINIQIIYFIFQSQLPNF